jgi:hypothetical protein
MGKLKATDTNVIDRPKTLGWSKWYLLPKYMVVNLFMSGNRKKFQTTTKFFPTYHEKFFWVQPKVFGYLICCNLSLGLATKVRVCEGATKSEPKSHISCSRECKRAWKNEPPHSQMNSHLESWNPNGFPNLQRVIVGVKTHWIEKFLKSLKNLGM